MKIRMSLRSIYAIIISVVVINACTVSSSELDGKKKELAKLKEESKELNKQIRALEAEIAAEDSTFLNQGENFTLISVLSPEKKEFAHKIEVRGSVQSRKNVVLSSEAMGRINNIHFTEGASVTEGQLLLEIDAQTLENSIDELRKSLELAKTVYERQKNLWENNIGSEIQYLQAKNNKELLEKRLSTANSQLQLSRVKAPFSGSIDELFVNEGEMAQMGAPLFRIISLEDIYIEADVSESFIGKFKKGDLVDVSFPSLDLSLKSRVNAIGQVINPRNRTFKMEIVIPEDNRMKPNLTAILQLNDYVNPEAHTIPTNIIQKDAVGDFIYVIKEEEGKNIAVKHHITRGVSFNGETEILEGITLADMIVNEGYRDVSDGMIVEIAKR